MFTQTLKQVSKPMLGRMLIRKGLISTTDLQDALVTQNKTGKKAG